MNTAPEKWMVVEAHQHVLGRPWFVGPFDTEQDALEYARRWMGDKRWDVEVLAPPTPFESDLEI